jgi:uncharacterized protein
MNEISKGKFYNITVGKLDFDGVVDEMINWMKEKPTSFYDVIVGCDSSSSEEPHFPIAVVILRKGEGGRFFLKKVRYKNKRFYNWRQRVLEEVLLSCDLALILKQKLKEKSDEAYVSVMLNSSDLISSQKFNYEFRYIHADIGGSKDTKDMIKEVTGLIIGNGFEPKIKPEAYAATVVADRFS